MNTVPALSGGDPPAMSTQMSNVHKDAIDNITFTKRLQWTLTNYAVALLAGIFGVVHVIKPLQPIEKVLLTIGAIVIAVVSAGLLIRLQCDMHRFRSRLAWINGKYFDCLERESLALSNSPKPLFHGGVFAAGLIGVIASALALIIYVVWRT